MTAQRFEVTLDGLRKLRRRIDHKQLEAADWALLSALVSKQIARAEQSQARMIAKVAAAAATSTDASEPAANTNASSDAGASTDSSSSSDANATSSDGTASPAGQTARDGEDAAGNGKPKGHGRNGASAYRSAQHLYYALAVGVIGAVCAVCAIGKMYRYREKIVIRIIGQPLFRAEQHHVRAGAVQALWPSRPSRGPELGPRRPRHPLRPV